MRDRSPEYYQRLFDTMVVLPGWHNRVCRRVVKLRSIWTRYLGYAAPPALLAVVHYMECGNDFNCQLLNGERWDRVTTLVPSGLGPWDSWGASTESALATHRLQNLHDIEAYNGWGYAMHGVHGVNSPYLWSGSNHGVGVGKYTSDGHYDPGAVSEQIGAALLLPALGYME